MNWNWAVPKLKWLGILHQQEPRGEKDFHTDKAGQKAEKLFDWLFGYNLEHLPDLKEPR